MTSGDLVWYRHAQRGGYGFETRVPAVFMEARGTCGRASIEVLLRDGTRKRISVLVTNLTPRTTDEAIVWNR